jgi:hypothetical protein
MNEIVDWIKKYRAEYNCSLAEAKDAYDKQRVCDKQDAKDYIDPWDNNRIQFARLISELEVVGAFCPSIMEKLCYEMDLTIPEVCNIIDRAQDEWDKIKSETR